MTTVASGPSCCATRNAATTLAPDDAPVNRPSSRASRHVDRCTVRAQRCGGAVDRMGGADGVDEGVDTAVGLRPDLVAEREVAVDRVVVVELIAPPVTRFGRDLTGTGDDALDQRLGDLAVVAGNLLDRGPQGAHHPPLFHAEGVGEHDVQPVAECGAHERKRDAGGARGVLDHGVAALEAAVGGSRLDRSTCHPILHAPGRVGELQLRQHSSTVRRGHADQFDERRSPDSCQCARGGCGHDSPSMLRPKSYDIRDGHLIGPLPALPATQPHIVVCDEISVGWATRNPTQTCGWRAWLRATPLRRGLVRSPLRIRHRT